MIEPSDPFWDELGIAWSAIDPDIRVIASRLAVRLRRQSYRMSAVFLIGLLFGAMGLALGVGTIGIGTSSGAWNFVIRGVALIIISVMVLLAVWSLQRFGTVTADSALSQMIDLALARTQKALSLIKSGLYACAIAAVFGFAGTAVRTHLGRPPKMSPIIDLVILGLIALVLGLYGHKIKLERRKYRLLKQALAVDAAA